MKLFKSLLESAVRVVVVTFVVLVWMMMAIGPAIAHEDDDRPRPAPTTAVVTSETGDHHREMFWGGATAGGLAIAALQKTEHPWLYSVAAVTAAALAANAASESISAKETRYAVMGAAAGASGVGLVFGKNFFGWQTAVKF